MATTIRTGAIYGVGVYGADRYGVSNVIFIPDGLNVTSFVGSLVVSGVANVSIVGVAATAFVGSFDVSAGATTPVTGVSIAADVGFSVVSGAANTLTIGVEATTAIGTLSIEAQANVSISGETATFDIGNIAISGGASTAISGVDIAFDIGSVVVLENEVVVLSGVSITIFVNDASVTTTSFSFDANAYEAERVVYVENKTPTIQRYIYIEQQPRIVVVEQKNSTAYSRTSNVSNQYRQAYVNRGTTSEERKILVEE